MSNINLPLEALNNLHIQRSSVGLVKAAAPWTGTDFENLTALAAYKKGSTPIPPAMAKKLEKFNGILFAEKRRMEQSAVRWKTAIQGLSLGSVFLSFDLANTVIPFLGLALAEWVGSKIESRKAEKMEEATDQKQRLLEDLKEQYQNLGNELIRQYVTPIETVARAHTRDRHGAVKQAEGNRELAVKNSQLLSDETKIAAIVKDMIGIKPEAAYLDYNVERLENPSWRKRFVLWITRQTNQEKLIQARKEREERVREIVRPLLDASKIVLELHERKDQPIPSNHMILRHNCMREFYLNVAENQHRGTSSSFVQSNSEHISTTDQESDEKKALIAAHSSELDEKQAANDTHLNPNRLKQYEVTHRKPLSELVKADVSSSPSSSRIVDFNDLNVIIDVEDLD